MALPLERWAKQAHLLEARGDFSPVADSRVLQDVNDLAGFHFQTWRMQQRAIEGPTNLGGVYAGLNAYPPSADVATVTLNATEAAFWPVASYSPIPANGVLAPEAFRLSATGNLTTPAGTQTMTITPRMGTSNTGITLGASSALTLTASITASFWTLVGDLTMRTVGAIGANSTAVGFFRFAGTNVAGAGAVSYNLLFGHTTATYDSSVANGLWIGAVTATTTGQTLTTKQVHWSSWN